MNIRTFPYDEKEVEQVAKLYNLTKPEARQKIYHREYYKQWYQKNRKEKLAYTKAYRVNNGRT